MAMLAIVNMLLLLIGFLMRLRKPTRITIIQQKLELPLKQFTNRQQR
jgi:hypothetical protein